MIKGQKASPIALLNMRFAAKNRKYTVFAKQKMKESHLGNSNSLGFKHSKEENIQNSIRNTGEGNAMFGKKQSEKTKQLIRNKAIGRKHSVLTRILMSNNKKGIKFTQKHKDKLREWHITNPNRKFKNTSIEIKIKLLLDNLGIKYIEQHPLCNIAITDFYIPSKKLAVFCDGCYWHRCPTHHPEDKYNRRDKDFLQTQVLEKNGYNVLRLWEHEINKITSLSI